MLIAGCASDPGEFRPAKGAAEYPPTKDAYRVQEPPYGRDRGRFKGHGLNIAIAFEGLGERSPLVKTADEVDEPRNRRVDYILALEPPALPFGEWKSP